MSYTEIYIREKGCKKWRIGANVSNAWAGCMHLWRCLEEKYLPSLDMKTIGFDEYMIKVWKENNTDETYCHRTTWSHCGKEVMQPIWDLQEDVRLTYEELMVFRSTLDRAMVVGKDIPLFIDCLEAVAQEHGGNYKEQAKQIRNLYNRMDGRISAIAFNQTSVCDPCDYFGSNMDKPMKELWDCIWSKEYYENQKSALC